MNDRPITPFFCENLFSDYLENLLPPERRQEMDLLLKESTKSARLFQDVKSTIEFTKSLAVPPLANEVSIKIIEAAEASREGFWHKKNVSSLVLFAGFPVLVFFALAYLLPERFSWFHSIKLNQNLNSFVRYQPLLHGGAEMIEEQANWLHVREPFMRSVWEEGGLSPEEFEKSFQVKGGKSIEENME
jgi:hypothetical protein